MTLNAKQITLALSIFLFCTASLKGQLPPQLILKFKNGAAALESSTDGHIMSSGNPVAEIARKFGYEKIKKQELGRNSGEYIYVIRFPEGTDLNRVIEACSATGEIEYAEEDHIGSGGGKQAVAPNDTYYSVQWGLHNDGSFSLGNVVAGADIDMENAWNIEQGDSNIIVAIMDGGLKMDHPEFAGRIWTNYAEIPNNGIDDDNNSFIDDLQGWDFANMDNDPTDDLGHGTNIASIIGAAGNNSLGFAGVDWNCRLMILKGLDNTNFGYYSWWADAIYYAVDNGAKVINLSAGGTSYSTTLLSAVNYAQSRDVLIVASMMNTNSGDLYYPARYNAVMAVGSTDPDDRRSNPFFWSSTSGSNFGTHISVVAPGNYIYGCSYQSNSNFSTYWGGTSQAAPHVAALAALLLAQDSSRTPAQIRSIIESTAEDEVGDPNEDVPGWDQYYGHGRVNAFEALSAINAVGADSPMDQEIAIYPNPTSESFVVRVHEKDAKIEVFNQLGQLEMAKQVDGAGAYTFQVAGSGMYYVKVSTESGTKTEKLVVRRQ